MYTFQIGNIRNKNADGMPQIMLYGGLMCSSCWLVYGLMLNDPNVYVSDLLLIVAVLISQINLMQLTIASSEIFILS